MIASAHGPVTEARYALIGSDSSRRSMNDMFACSVGSERLHRGTDWNVKQLLLGAVLTACGLVMVVGGYRLRGDRSAGIRWTMGRALGLGVICVVIGLLGAIGRL